MDVASLPGDTPDKVLSQITRMLVGAGISCDITSGAFGSEPARYDIHVPADKQAEAMSLLKQDAAIHKYQIEVFCAKYQAAVGTDRSRFTSRVGGGRLFCSAS